MKYGLCASIWSENVGRVHRVAQQLLVSDDIMYHTIPITTNQSTLFFQVGTVWCNCWLLRDLNVPFGGIKASGIGSEGNFESLKFYTNVKTVCVKY